MSGNHNSFFSKISTLSFKNRLGKNTKAFISEITYINFVRLRIISLVALILFSILWIWDIILFSNGKWNESIGYQIVTYFHSFLLIFLTGVQILCWKKHPKSPESVNISHKKFITATLAVVLFCTVFLAIGDTLTNGSIAAYLGMIFACAAIFIMTNRFSLLLFGANITIMIFFLAIIYLTTGKSMNIQIVNAAAFTVSAFILSRVLFSYNLNDFINRTLIYKQTSEIEEQIKSKEKLIAELMESQKDLRNSEARLKALSDASFEAIFVSDGGVCLDQNLAAENLFGYTHEEAVGRPGAEWVVPEDRQVVIRNIVTGHETPYEANALRKDGTTFPCEIQARMVAGDDNKSIRVTSLRDITDRKQAEAEKIKVLTEAAETKKLALVGRIAGKMAHDFNNILSIIMGNAELSLLSCRDAEAKKTFELIFEQTIRGKNLTKNLVAFAKDREPEQKHFQITQKIELVLNLLKNDLDGINIVREYGQQDLEILADPEMIEHMLVNILQNSIHAISLVERPEITIRTFHNENQVCIEIEDNGCGIPQESLDKIFEPSFTLKGSRDKSGSYKSGIKGTGYGLSNIKKYVAQHKGLLSIDSVFKKGTKISIFLPVIEMGLTEKEIAGIDKEKICHDKNILLVEDEQAISAIQYKILTQEPCSNKVDIASSGQTAIDLFNKNEYDLVSLDYILPGGLNGIDVYNHIRGINTDIPILFVSGNIEFLKSIKELKQKDPYIDHLSKPCMNIDYLNCINTMSENSSCS